MRKNKKIKSYLPPYRRYLKYLLKFFRFVAVAGAGGAAAASVPAPPLFEDASPEAQAFLAAARAQDRARRESYGTLVAEPARYFSD